MEVRRVLLRNPKNNHRAWFKLPFYLGQLVKIGLSGSYSDQVIVEDIEGDIEFPYGPCLVEDLELLNKKVETSIAHAQEAQIKKLINEIVYDTDLVKSIFREVSWNKEQLKKQVERHSVDIYSLLLGLGAFDGLSEISKTEIFSIFRKYSKEVEKEFMKQFLYLDFDSQHAKNLEL